MKGGKQNRGGSFGGGLHESGRADYVDRDGTETVEAWDCHPDCPVRMLDEQSGENCGGSGGAFKKPSLFFEKNPVPQGYNDKGSASRFFYIAKPSKWEKEQGMSGEKITPEQMTGRKAGSPGLVMEGGKANPYAGPTGAPRRNAHPTVKPIALMRYLIRLVTPPGGTVLDPFLGSGTTLCAIHTLNVEGHAFRGIGIEREAEYVEIARARVSWYEKNAEQWRFHENGNPDNVPPGQMRLFQPSQKEEA
jgi:hypothetical protein